MQCPNDIVCSCAGKMQLPCEGINVPEHPPGDERLFHEVWSESGLVEVVPAGTSRASLLTGLL